MYIKTYLQYMYSELYRCMYLYTVYIIVSVLYSNSYKQYRNSSHINSIHLHIFRDFRELCVSIFRFIAAFLLFPSLDSLKRILSLKSLIIWRIALHLVPNLCPFLTVYGDTICLITTHTFSFRLIRISRPNCI